MKDNKPVVVGIGELLWECVANGEACRGVRSILYTMVPNWG